MIKENLNTCTWNDWIQYIHSSVIHVALYLGKVMKQMDLNALFINLFWIPWSRNAFFVILVWFGFVFWWLILTGRLQCNNVCLVKQNQQNVPVLHWIYIIIIVLPTIVVVLCRKQDVYYLTTSTLRGFKLISALSFVKSHFSMVRKKLFDTLLYLPFLFHFFYKHIDT